MKRVIFCILVLFLLTGCASQKKTTRDFFAMDTVMSLTVYGKNADAAISAAQTEINAMEKTLSVTKADSAVARLNAAGTAELPEDAIALLKRTLELSEKTGGALSPTLYRLTSLWGFTTGDYRVPTAEELEAALAEYRGGSVSLSNITVSLDGRSLDFGAVAKGEASDRVCGRLKENGVSSAILSLGGNVQTVGLKPDGERWSIAIRDPKNEADYVGILSVGETAVVTSGGYQRFFEENGKRYIHILDPETGYPVENGLASVTVVAPSGFYADGLSTALYVMGKQQAVEFWRSAGDFEAVFVVEDGSVFVTKGLADSFDCPDFQVIE